ncbi:MAG TPA: putative metal-dependent hydrolase [Gemmatimonadaceae bacterium]|nr:putative metal-dependent hydrolase [Gemmatimonadaceae bacterium]
MEDLRYPIGRFSRPDSLTPAARRAAIDTIAQCPAQMRAVVNGLDDAQLDTRYRPDGWTVRQLVHHVPDSHVNAYVRTKLALTEDTPTIKPYDEAAWARLPDAESTPIETSLRLLETVHDRWVRVLQAMRPADFERTLEHPENGLMTLDQLVATYDWHSRHHVAHIRNLRERNGW